MSRSKRKYTVLEVLSFVRKIGTKAGEPYGGEWPDSAARNACWVGCKVKFPGIVGDTELHPFLEPVYVFSYRRASVKPRVGPPRESVGAWHGV